MCQLLGFSSTKPAGFASVFNEFRKRGKLHPHAWGIALWNGDSHGPLVIRDPHPANKSAVAGLLGRSRVPGNTLIAHIRYGTTKGDNSLKTGTNAHPFVANISGCDWAFAHNGFVRISASEFSLYRPIGTTDSEKVFSRMVVALNGARGQDEIAGAVKMVAKTCSPRGKLNFLLSNGELLFFFSNRENNLFYRERTVRDVSSVMVATQRIGTGKWKPCVPGRLYVAKAGIVMKDIFVVDVSADETTPKSKGAFQTYLPPGKEDVVRSWRLWDARFGAADFNSQPAEKLYSPTTGRHKSYIDYLEEDVNLPTAKAGGLVESGGIRGRR